MPSVTASADARQLLDRADLLARHSSSPTEIERFYLTPQHASVNQLVAGWMSEAGLVTGQDAAGNLIGRLEGSHHGLPGLMLGSHLDTVPGAGRYDGILGVLAAIAVAKRLAGVAATLPFAVEVVAFGDEEGSRFGTTLLGSRAVAGTWDEGWWELADEQGITLREAFVEFGLDPARLGDAARAPHELAGYLEVHIEQGPRLEDADRALGVVSGIAAARRLVVTLTGEARHCATPYDRRRDALAGAAESVLVVESMSRDAATPATVGRIEALPGAVNVIPGEARFSVDVRAETDEHRDASWAAIERRIGEVAEARGLTLAVEETHRAPAVVCSGRLAEEVRRGIRSTGDRDPLTLFSIAGHDAMAMAHVTDVGMAFVRCAGGISHHADESVTAEDTSAAIDALEATVLHLAGQ